MENIINEEQLENMRNKAKKLEKIVIILSIISFPLYIWLFYIALVEDEKLSALLILKLIFVAAVLLVATFGLLWLIIVRPTYDKFNVAFKSKYVLQTINQISGFDKLQYIPKGGFLWDDVKNATIVACGDKRYYESEDLLFGEYENVGFKISDVVTKKWSAEIKKIVLKKYLVGKSYAFTNLMI